MKKLLAKHIVTELFDKLTAETCLHNFEQMFSKKTIPLDPTKINADNVLECVMFLRNCSKTQARRLFTQKAVKVWNGESFFSITEDADIEFDVIIKVGKKDFCIYGNSSK